MNVLCKERFIIIGAGKSGIAAARLLRGRGASEVLLYDQNKDLDTGEVSKKAGVPVLAGGLNRMVLKDFDIAVFSPGVPLDCEDALLIKECGLKIIGEIELGYLFSKGRIAAITGTNGKTTTTALTGELLKRSFSDVRVVGNIGEPYTENIEDTSEDTVIVAEISSFQLETVETFAPDAAAILNITPDHLNRHHTMEAYIEAKENIAKNTKCMVLNYDDPELRAFGESLLKGAAEVKVIWFSVSERLTQGYFYENGHIFGNDTGVLTDIIAVNEMNIIGLHNYENAMAAVALASELGASLSDIREGLKSFVAVAHRIEFAGEIGGVRYYDDSKATNTDAAIKGIQAMPGPTYLIGGGYDKGSRYHDWIRAFDGKVKELLLIGTTKEKIKNDAAECGFNDCEFFDSLESAFDYAREHAKSGENVLLSPACASWDMFKSYEQRGDMFKEMVRDGGARKN